MNTFESLWREHFKYETVILENPQAEKEIKKLLAKIWHEGYKRGYDNGCDESEE